MGNYEALNKLVIQLDKVAIQLRRGIITAREAKSQEVRILSAVISDSRTITERLCEELGYWWKQKQFS